MSLWIFLAIACLLTWLVAFTSPPICYLAWTVAVIIVGLVIWDPRHRPPRTEQTWCDGCKKFSRGPHCPHC